MRYLFFTINFYKQNKFQENINDLYECGNQSALIINDKRQIIYANDSNDNLINLLDIFKFECLPNKSSLSSW